MGSTRADLEAESYQILGERDTSNEYSPAIVQAKLSEVHKRVCQ